MSCSLPLLIESQKAPWLMQALNGRLIGSQPHHYRPAPSKNCQTRLWAVSLTDQDTRLSQHRQQSRAAAPGQNRQKKFTMPKTLEKTRKQIAKKKGKAIDSLHEKSRNARRLHRAQIRDDRLEKIAQTRRKQDKPLRRCPYFEAHSGHSGQLTADSRPCGLLPGVRQGERVQTLRAGGHPGQDQRVSVARPVSNDAP
jgi:hypothetical protein